MLDLKIFLNAKKNDKKNNKTGFHLHKLPTN